MKKIFPVIVASSLLFTSCKNNDSTTESGSFDSSIVATPPATTTTVSTDSNTNITATPAQAGQPVPGITLPTPGATTATPAVSTASTAAGMNPAHGQPGHRCDIAVGAPLNSAPAKPAATTTAQPAVTATPAAAPVKTAPGMNPPHGQPGHKCEIAVGAPLNSAPAKTTSTTPAKAETESKTGTIGTAADTSAKH